MLEKALRTSNLLSIVDGTKMPPDVTPTNSSEYTPEAIMPLIRADGTREVTVIAEDDCYKFYADSIVAFTFMMSMIDKDMHHMLSGAIREENSTMVYKVIQEHFKGDKNHHIESPCRKRFVYGTMPIQIVSLREASPRNFLWFAEFRTSATLASPFSGLLPAPISGQVVLMNLSLYPVRIDEYSAFFSLIRYDGSYHP